MRFDTPADVDHMLARLRDRLDQVEVLRRSTSGDDFQHLDALLQEVPLWVAETLMVAGSLLASVTIPNASAYRKLVEETLENLQRDMAHFGGHTTLQEAIQRYAPQQPALRVWLMTGELTFADGWSPQKGALLTALLASPDTTASTLAVLARQAAQAGEYAAPEPHAIFERALTRAEDKAPLANTLLEHAPQHAKLAFEHATNQLTPAAITTYLLRYLRFFQSASAVPPGGRDDDGRALVQALQHHHAPTPLAVDVLRAWYTADRNVRLPDKLTPQHNGPARISDIVAKHLKPGIQPKDRDSLLNLLAYNLDVTRALARTTHFDFTSDDLIQLSRRGLHLADLMPYLMPHVQKRLFLERAEDLPRGLTLDPVGLPYDLYRDTLTRYGWDQDAYEQAALTTWPEELARDPHASPAILERVARLTLHETNAQRAEQTYARLLANPHCPHTAIDAATAYLTTPGKRFTRDQRHDVVGPTEAPRLLKAMIRRLPTPQQRQELLDQVERTSGRAYHPQFKVELGQKPQPKRRGGTPQGLTENP